MKNKTLYDTLEVDKDSPNIKDDVKRAYRKKAMECHPDKGGDATEFNEISQAYRILSDDRYRDEYNRTGKTNTNEENILGMCIERIDAIFQQLLAAKKDTIHTFDWIRELIIHFENIRNSLLHNIVMAEDELPKIEKIIKNIIYKGKGYNILVESLKMKLVQFNAQISFSKKEVEIVNNCIIILKDYSLVHIDTPQTQQNTYTNYQTFRIQFGNTTA